MGLFQDLYQEDISRFIPEFNLGFQVFFRVIPRNVFQEVLGHFLFVFVCLRFLRVCVFACLRVCVLVGFVILFCDGV